MIMGCVLQAGAGMNVARQAALKAGLPDEVPGETVNRVCGSGLQAVVHAVEAIRVGYVDTIVAGGTESMSNAPYLLEGRTLGLPRWATPRSIDSMLHEGLTCAIESCHMGITAEEIASALQRVARRSGCVCRREPAVAPSVRSPKDDSRTRSFRSRFRRRRAIRCGRRHRRISACRHDRREARGAEAGVQEGRHRSPPATRRASTTAPRARRGRDAERRRSELGAQAARAHPRHAVDRRRSQDHGHRTRAGRPQGARPRRA